MTKSTFFALLSILFLSAIRVSAQTANVRGKVVESKTKSPLSGAHVKLINSADPSETFITSTNDNGNYSFSGLKLHAYTLEATYVGCTMFTKTIRIDNQSMELPTCR